MTIQDAVATIMQNAGIAGTGTDPRCLRELAAALRYCASRLLLPELSSTYTETTTYVGQDLFTHYAVIQHVIRTSFVWIDGTTRTPLDWRRPTSVEPRYPYCVYLEGYEFKINANTTAIGNQLEYQVYDPPALGSVTSEFPFPNLEDYCINQASAKVLVATDSAKAASFASVAKSLWTSVVASVEQ